MQIRQYIVDAFTDRLFHGNQAAVCVLEKWLPESLMMDIARENNFSETAFTVKEEKGWHLRWFTPGGEIDLCGHATLATVFVLFNYYEKQAQTVSFQTQSGVLTVSRDGELLSMDFPAYALKEVPVTDLMEEVLGVRPVKAFMGRDLLCIFSDAKKVKECRPDLEKAKELDGLLLHITAQGEGPYDCTSRSFAPKLSVVEDPVCGSGHCHIIPYWADTLHRDQLTAYQASARGGELYCRMNGDRVTLAGKAVLFSAAELNL